VANLIVLQGPQKGRSFQTGSGVVLLGRDSDEIALTDQTVSRRHCELRPDNGTWILRDLQSANGSYVNGVRVHQQVRLKHGDQIKLGSTLMVYSGDESVAKLSGPRTRGLIDMDVGPNMLDSSIQVRVPSSEDSVIIAAPETAQAVHAWRVMYQMAEAVGAIPSPEQLLERMMDIVFEQVDVDRGFVLLRDEETKEMIPQVVRYRKRTQEEPPERISTSRRIINLAVQNREGVLCTNAATDERFARDKGGGSIHDYGLRSVICAPVAARDDVLGVIHVDCSISNHTYTEHQLRLITAIGAMSGLAIENARLVQERMQTERLTATGETVAYLSHSIKNILQGLRSGADIVEMGLSRKNLSTISDGWPIVLRNLDRIYNLTMNMLAFSKEREPRHENQQLNAILADAVELVQAKADAAGVALFTEFEDPFPAIPLDTDGIQQVALNLLLNALDAARKPDGVVTLRTSYDAKEGVAIFSVADDGPGIPPDEIKHVFEAFHSTKGQGGTGLGLAVARKIITEHRGTIEVESSDDGTTMIVKLPAVHVEIALEETHGPAR